MNPHDIDGIPFQHQLEVRIPLMQKFTSSFSGGTPCLVLETKEYVLCTHLAGLNDQKHTSLLLTV